MPPPPGVREHNLGDLWRGVWHGNSDIPGVKLDQTYILLFMAGRGYVVRESESDTWGTIEATPARGRVARGFRRPGCL